MDRAPLREGLRVRVVLRKPDRTSVEYPAVVERDDGTHVVVSATWPAGEGLDLGYVRFEPGDRFREHFWRDRWYSVKEIRTPTGVRKGWYCDVARPAQVAEGSITSEDLHLDLWVDPDGQVLRLDEDEFRASGLPERDPPAARAALASLIELERLAADGFSGLDAGTPG